VLCTHDQYQAGDHCPQCARGRLHRSRPLIRLRFTGQPLANVTHYELEQLRCGACGSLFVAHYHLGLAFKRIESFQHLVGMPLPDATQWELVEQVADSVYPLYEYLKRLGAQQPLVFQDDTGARILSLIAENQAERPPARKGMFTTVLRFEASSRSVCTSPGASTQARISLRSWPSATRICRPSNGCPMPWRPIPPRDRRRGLWT